MNCSIHPWGRKRGCVRCWERCFINSNGHTQLMNERQQLRTLVVRWCRYRCKRLVARGNRTGCTLWCGCWWTLCINGKMYRLTCILSFHESGNLKGYCLQGSGPDPCAWVRVCMSVCVSVCVCVCPWCVGKVRSGMINYSAVLLNATLLR